MAKKCIICDGAAGSKEHVFPAALGGRRVCKSIFCGTHNEFFSPLAAHLSRQLGVINSLLAVRPDHQDDPRTTTISGDNGEVVHLSGTGASLVQGASPEKGTRISLQFGGPKGLRAIGYVALTFFARYFPALAACNELDDFKSYVSATGQGDYVWWEGPEAADTLPSHPFRFGHTIALQVSAADQIACARISLFASLNFMVKLGTVKANSNENMIVHINPQAELPKDITEERGKGLLFETPASSPGTENLGRMIKDRSAQAATQSLFSKIHDETGSK